MIATKKNIHLHSRNLNRTVHNGLKIARECYKYIKKVIYIEDCSEVSPNFVGFSRD